MGVDYTAQPYHAHCGAQAILKFHVELLTKMLKFPEGAHLFCLSIFVFCVFSRMRPPLPYRWGPRLIGINRINWRHKHHLHLRAELPRGGHKAANGLKSHSTATYRGRGRPRSCDRKFLFGEGRVVAPALDAVPSQHPDLCGAALCLRLNITDLRCA